MTSKPSVQAAHAHSSGHREEILESDVCGCFYCKSTFAPSEILDWVDEVDGVGTTALCPHCGIDAVIGSASGYPIDDEFLGAMNQHWF